jgi:hypothetical protein
MLEPAAQEELGTVFKELVEVDAERGIPTRKRAPLHRCASTPAAQHLLERFTEARLLVRDNAAGGEVVVEVAHEALLTSWQRLHAWITERFDDLRLWRQVRLEAVEWQRRGSLTSHLWRHERLQPVYAMCQRLQPTLSPIEQEFIRPEAERLLEEIADPATSHRRRTIIGDRLAEIGDPRSGVGLDSRGLPDFVWLPVPGGEVTLEEGAGTFTVPPFHISKYPVTWVQYRSFLQAPDGYHNPHWWRGLAEPESEPGEQYRQQDNHPAENVSWYDAIAFCRWLSVHLGYEVRLPTEWEWQQAATGGDPARIFPWGEDENGAYTNTWESGLSRTTAVGLYPQGASPGGMLDMSGNVWEWCLNEYYDPRRIGLSGNYVRVLRGGSWGDGLGSARTSMSNHMDPWFRTSDRGLRIMRVSPTAFSGH